MLTRREVEGELRSLGFRATARRRRAERERALRFARGLLGALFGLGLLVMLGAVNLLSSTPSDLAFGHSRTQGNEWVSSGSSSGSSRRPSLFFTGRRTWHPNDPRSRNRGRHSSDD